MYPPKVNIASEKWWLEDKPFLLGSVSNGLKAPHRMDHLSGKYAKLTEGGVEP